MKNTTKVNKLRILFNKKFYKLPTQGQVAPFSTRLFCLAFTLISMVQEHQTEDEQSYHHRKGTSVVWVSRQNEPFILRVLSGTHRHLEMKTKQEVIRKQLIRKHFYSVSVALSSWQYCCSSLDGMLVHHRTISRISTPQMPHCLARTHLKIDLGMYPGKQEQCMGSFYRLGISARAQLPCLSIAHEI